MESSPLHAAIGSRIQRVETVSGSDGAPHYFVVYMTTGTTGTSGFIIVSGNDLVEPIVAFSTGDHFDRNQNSPFQRLLTGDIPARVERVRSHKIEANSVEGVATVNAKQKWDALLQNTSLDTSIASVSDLRVAPLVSSLWNQLNVNNEGCYNYYTPPYAPGSAQNDPSGCVATALAQLMRFYQYPAGSVGTPGFSITISGVPTIRTLLGGNGFGGPYRWSDMILAPNNTITESQRQAIGALIYDAGVSVGMQYNTLANGGSGADTLATKNSLVSVFSYSNAIKGNNNSYDIGPGLVGMINPNLDAGFPVLLGITGPPGGHAIVCDGYGYSLNTLYHHLNMGWSGVSNVWYALPTIDSAAGTFTSVYKCVYNIYVSGYGEIISGRVMDSKGIPVQGAVVSAVSATGTFTATSGSNGIYAIAKIPSATSYLLNASKTGYVSVSGAATTGISYDYAPQSGNVWNVNFTMDARVNYPLNISDFPIQGGVAVGGGNFLEGTTTLISATANPDWTFAGWNDGDMTNPRTVTIPTGGASYTANFIVNNSMQLASLGSGTINFPSNFSWSYQGSATALRLLFSTGTNMAVSSVAATPDTITGTSYSLGADRWRIILGELGVSDSTYYWTVGFEDASGNLIPLADWEPFIPDIPAKAEMISPVNGTTLKSGTVTLSWSAALQATQYNLWIGSAPDTYDLYAGTEGNYLSRTVTLPTDGRTIYVKLWSMVNGAWQSNQYAYTAAGLAAMAKASLVSPVSGTVLSGSQVAFNWNAGAGVSQYAIWIGSTPDSYDLCAKSLGTALFQTVTLPADGRAIYVKLWSMINGTWQSTPYTFTAYTTPGTAQAAMIAPLDNSVLQSSTVTLSWDSGSSVTKYAIWIGSTPDSYDLCAKSLGTALFQTVTLPADGRAIYVKLWSMINGTWAFRYYTFTASDGRARMLSPTPGAALNSTNATFTWNAGTDVSQYALWIGSTPDSYDLYAKSLGTTLSQVVTLPGDGRTIYVRLWSMMNGAWTWQSYTYTASNITAKVIAPPAGAVFPSSTGTLSWNSGTGATQYALWVGSNPGTYDIYAGTEGVNHSKIMTLPNDGRPIYVKLWSLIDGAWQGASTTYYASSGKANIVVPAAGATLTSSTVAFSWDGGTNVSQYALWVGSKPDSYDLYAANEGANHSQTVTLSTSGRTIYVRLWSMINGAWQYNSYSYIAP